MSNWSKGFWASELQGGGLFVTLQMSCCFCRKWNCLSFACSLSWLGGLIVKCPTLVVRGTIRAIWPTWDWRLGKNIDYPYWPQSSSPQSLYLGSCLKGTDMWVVFFLNQLPLRRLSLIFLGNTTNAFEVGPSWLLRVRANTRGCIA